MNWPCGRAAGKTGAAERTVRTFGKPEATVDYGYDDGNGRSRPRSCGLSETPMHAAAAFRRATGRGTASLVRPTAWDGGCGLACGRIPGISGMWILEPAETRPGQPYKQKTQCFFK